MRKTDERRMEMMQIEYIDIAENDPSLYNSLDFNVSVPLQHGRHALFNIAERCVHVSNLIISWRRSP